MATIRLPRDKLLAGVVVPALALLVALAAGHILVLLFGQSPARVFAALVAGTWGNPYGLGQVLFKATPLVFTGLAVAIPFRAGLFNIGAEGQAVLGALAAGILGAHLPVGTPWPIAVPTVALTAFLAGASWGAVPGWLKAKFGAHEVITTIMMNFLAMALVNYLLVTSLAVPETLHTAPITRSARLARLGAFIPAFHGSAVSTAFVVALLVALAAWWFLFRTPMGFEVLATGLNGDAARAAGIDPRSVTTWSMALAGGLAGLVSTGFVQGYKYYFEEGFSGGIGFMGIAVALLGRNHPAGIVLAALLFGTLSQGGLVINALVPKELVEILQAVVILSVVAVSQEVRAAIRAEARP